MVLFKSQLIETSNSYRFLITLLHELAHYDVYRKYAHILNLMEKSGNLHLKNSITLFKY